MRQLVDLQLGLWALQLLSGLQDGDEGDGDHGDGDGHHGDGHHGDGHHGDCLIQIICGSISKNGQNGRKNDYIPTLMFSSEGGDLSMAPCGGIGLVWLIQIRELQ